MIQVNIGVHQLFLQQKKTAHNVCNPHHPFCAVFYLHHCMLQGSLTYNMTTLDLIWQIVKQHESQCRQNILY